MKSTTIIQPTYPPKNLIIATILSLLFGGIGQVYLGQVKKGFIITAVYIVIGMITMIAPLIALLSAFDAYIIAKRLKSGTSVGNMEFFWEEESI
jgi:TM2 domain-containing membrane protein YozV